MATVYDNENMQSLLGESKDLENAPSNEINSEINSEDYKDTISLIRLFYILSGSPYRGFKHFMSYENKSVFWFLQLIHYFLINILYAYYFLIWILRIPFNLPKITELSYHNWEHNNTLCIGGNNNYSTYGSYNCSSYEQYVGCIFHPTEDSFTKNIHFKYNHCITKQDVWMSNLEMILISTGVFSGLSLSTYQFFYNDLLSKLWTTSRSFEELSAQSIIRYRSFYCCSKIQSCYPFNWEWKQKFQWIIISTTFVLSVMNLKDAKNTLSVAIYDYVFLGYMSAFGVMYGIGRAFSLKIKKKQEHLEKKAKDASEESHFQYILNEASTIYDEVEKFNEAMNYLFLRYILFTCMTILFLVFQILLETKRVMLDALDDGTAQVVQIVFTFFILAVVVVTLLMLFSIGKKHEDLLKILARNSNNMVQSNALIHKLKLVHPKIRICCVEITVEKIITLVMATIVPIVGDHVWAVFKEITKKHV